MAQPLIGSSQGPLAHKTTKKGLSKDTAPHHEQIHSLCPSSTPILHHTYTQVSWRARLICADYLEQERTYGLYSEPLPQYVACNLYTGDVAEEPSTRKMIVPIILVAAPTHPTNTDCALGISPVNPYSGVKRHPTNTSPTPNSTRGTSRPMVLFCSMEHHSITTDGADFSVLSVSFCLIFRDQMEQLG